MANIGHAAGHQAECGKFLSTKKLATGGLRERGSNTIFCRPSGLAAGTVVGTIKLLHDPGADDAETHHPGEVT
ncbi:hypothetical protein [Magnetospirillum molischianum]|uniref:hypothetical protein n=1 Tax=Magnetospirillum molischianum TaxID=1083 RepID=UPI0005907290|nr:hypothetical protein [Magnetospirillum molischianum]